MSVPPDRRKPNTVLKAVRLGLRMSQSEFARAVRAAGDELGEPNECTRRLQQKWESGEHAGCRPNYRRALEHVTGLPYSQLGFQDADDYRPSPAEAAVLDALFTTTKAQAAHVGVRGGHEAADRLRYALARPAHADTEAWVFAEATTAELFARDQREPARLLIHAAARHLTEVAALLAATRRETARRRLMLAGGAAAALAGRLALEQNDPAAAHSYLDAALATARAATDGPLLACTLTYLSQAAADRGDPANAWQLAHAAARHAEPGGRAHAWMLARAAQAAALYGDAGAAIAELDAALSIGKRFGPCTPEDPTPPWSRMLDACYLWAMAAQVYTRLNLPDQAHHAADSALGKLADGQTKSRALILAEAACALAYAGNAHRAYTCAADALALCETLDPAPGWRRLRALLSLLPEPDSTAQKTLHARLSVLTASPGLPGSARGGPEGARRRRSGI